LSLKQRAGRFTIGPLSLFQLLIYGSSQLGPEHDIKDVGTACQNALEFLSWLAKYGIELPDLSHYPNLRGRVKLGRGFKEILNSLQSQEDFSTGMLSNLSVTRLRTIVDSWQQPNAVYYLQQYYGEINLLSRRP
jgi:hypothetical protein